MARVVSGNGDVVEIFMGSVVAVTGGFVDEEIVLASLELGTGFVGVEVSAGFTVVDSTSVLVSVVTSVVVEIDAKHPSISNLKAGRTLVHFTGLIRNADTRSGISRYLTTSLLSSVFPTKNGVFLRDTTGSQMFESF